MASLPFEQMSDEDLVAYGKKQGPYLSDEKFEALKSEFAHRGLDDTVLYAKEERAAIEREKLKASSLPLSKEDAIATKLKYYKHKENYGIAFILLGIGLTIASAFVNMNGRTHFIALGPILYGGWYVYKAQQGKAALRASAEVEDPISRH